MTRKMLVVLTAVAALAGCSHAAKTQQSAAPVEPVLALDFGPGASPVAPGYARMGSRTMYEAQRRYGWIKTPNGEFDRPDADPLDDLSRDGVVFTTDQPCTLRVDLPDGDYQIEARMGDRAPTEFRPNMYIVADGKPLVTGILGSAGLPLPVRADLTVFGGHTLLTFGNKHSGRASGGLCSLVIRPRQGPSLQWHQLDAKTLRPAARWLAKEKLRLVYGGAELYEFDPQAGHFVDRSKEYWQRVADMGFNAMAGAYDTEMVRFLTDRKVRFFHTVNFGTGEAYALVEHELPLKNVVAGRGVDNRPAPTDYLAWKKLMVDETMRVYRQAQADKLPLAGVFIDLEMYGAKYSEVYTSASGFDDAAFGDFMKEHADKAVPANLAPEKRRDWLSSQGLLQAYFSFLEERAAAMFQQVRQEIHAAAPDLLLGYLQHFDNWFFRGMIRGLGTARMPVIALTENTYYGYNYGAPVDYEWFASKGMHVAFVPGFWPRTIHPDNLVGQAYAATVEADGWWLFGNTQTQPENVARYDAAMTKVNDLLDQTIKSKKVDRTVTAQQALAPLEDWTKRPDDKVVVNDADPHATKLVELPTFADAIRKFDMGQPKSPVMEGWTPLYSSDLYDTQRGYGWQRRPRSSSDRADAPNINALTRDAIVVQGISRLSINVPPGRYKVSVILGDMSPREWRTHQNVRVGSTVIAKDVTTNPGEYRLFEAEVDSGPVLTIEFEGRGAQRNVIVQAVAVTPVKK